MSIYLKLIWAYLKIGIFGFGGGYAMLSLVEHSVVDPGWITETMFTDIVAISQMTPGPIGINSATYIGFVAPGEVNPALASPLWGILGSLLATLAVVLPSFFLVIYSSHFIRRHQESGAIKAVFSGLRPVVVGLIASAAILLMNNANFNPNGISWQLLTNIIICVAAFCLVYFKFPWRGRKVSIHPILVIILAGLTGYLIYGL
ncbi:chromate transporter [bacterium]|nr:chromate transporter [Bacteroides sp.]MBD5385405.1 chromate transporter [bacterium]MDE6806447.1 chromate transporter [Muribaculaceae bacterium]MDE7509363.1 chromate transporter [Muribaculaceae bacterium]